MKDLNPVESTQAEATPATTQAEAAGPETTDVEDATDEHILDVAAAPVGVKPLGIHALIVREVFEAALGPELVRRVATPGDGVCVCLSVPDASWETPLREAARHYGRPVQVMFRDVAARRGADADTVSQFAKWLHQGSALVCASQDARVGLPAQLRSVADAVLRLHPPSPDEILRVIGTLGGGLPDAMAPGIAPPDLGSGLGLDEVVACLRVGEHPTATFARLRRVQAGKRLSAVEPDGPRLEDLAGYGAAADWAARLHRDLDAYREGRIAWRRLDSRAVLFGPPGTGKSLFAPALARSLGVGCLRTSVGKWFTTHSGDLGQTVRAATAAFDEARAAARAHGAVVLFVDELDGLPDRGAIGAREGSWWRPVVNHVLAMVDGDGTDLDGVVLVAATNDIGAVDAALLRPGRFGSHLAVMPPGLDDLVSVVTHHLGGTSCPVPRETLADTLRPLVGATPAQAAAWASEAMRRARAEGREVAAADVAAVVLPGDARPERDRRRVATHEAGHAVAAALLAGDRLVSTSIRPTADSNGGTALRPRDEALLRRDEVEDDVVVLLAGRAAEVVVGDGATAAAGGVGPDAASSDLARATARITAVHASYGLGRTLRHRGDPPTPGGLHHDRQVPRLVEADLGRLMARAERLVRDHGAAVRAVADALLARAYLDAAEVRRTMAPAGTGWGVAD